MQTVPPLLHLARPVGVPRVEDPEALLRQFPGRRFWSANLGVVHDKDFMAFKGLGPEIVFCDVGANAGHSVNSLRLLGCHAQVHSFEINPALWPDLSRCGEEYPGEFYLHRFGLGSTQGFVELFIPVVGPDAITTLASTSLEELQSRPIRQWVRPGDDVRVVKIQVEVRALDSLGLRPDIIKLDIEGLEVDAIKGMRQTIDQWRPMLLVENTHPRAVDTMMAGMGYIPCGLNRRDGSIQVGRHPSMNSFYLHATQIVRRDHEGLLPYAKILRENAFAGGLSDKPSCADVEAAFYTFFGRAPTPPQRNLHLQAHPTRLALRNHFIRFLLGPPT